MKIRPLLPWLAACTLLFSVAACEKKVPVQTPPPTPTPVPAPPKLVSAEPNSFDAVAKHLDAGGGLYFYLSSENFLKNASENLAAIAPAILDSLDAPAARAQAEAAWKALSSFTANSGLNEISGYGVSSIALEPGFYQSKWMLHHYPGKGNGLLWQISSPTPNAVEFASYLPEKTAVASSGNLKLATIWKALNEAAVQNPALAETLGNAARQFQQSTGLDLPAFLASLGPNYSLLVTLDESRPAQLPCGPAGIITLPEPALALLIQVQDDLLINRLDQQLSALPLFAKSAEGELQFRTLASPLPVAYIRPAIAWKPGLLILSSSEALIREIFEIKAGKKPGLAATPAFKRLFAGLPTEGSGFSFITPAFQKAVSQIQTASLKQSNPSNNAAVQKLTELVARLNELGSACSVSQDTPEGWLGVTRGATDPAAALGTAIPAVLAGVAVPAFVQAQKQVQSQGGHNQAAQVLDDLRLLDAATDQWAVERSKPRGSQPTTDDLLPYLKPGTPLSLRLKSAPGSTSVPSGVPGMPNIVLPLLDTQLTVPVEIVQKFQSTCPPGFWGPYQPK